MNKALSIAFSGGAVMGMCVAGFGVFGVSIIYIMTKNVDIITGFSLELLPSRCLPVSVVVSTQKLLT